MTTTLIPQQNNTHQSDVGYDHFIVCLPDSKQVLVFLILKWTVASKL